MASDDPFGDEPAGPPVHADPLVGAVLDGRYRVVEPLGAGGVADVYRGETEGMRRKVAIKVLQEDFGANENLRGRFEREARALAALSHPHIVTMIDYGITEGMPYLVMELLEGRTLADLLDEETTLRPERAFHITRQIVRALIFAHGLGLIHRDLKPANVFLQDLPGEADHVKILDFGFAKFLEGDEEGPVLTRTGMVFGTPPYMAPEQVTGKGVDGRCDIYATTVMLFEMFADQRPFEGETQELLRNKLTKTAPSLDDVCPDLVVRPELLSLLARDLSRNPADRHATAAEFGEALDAIPQPAVRPKGGWDSLVGVSVQPDATTLPRPPVADGARAKKAGIPRWTLWAGGIGVILIGLLVCGGAATWWLLGRGDEGEATVATEAPGAAPSEPTTEEATGTAGPEEANPWQGSVSAPLAAMHRKVSAGRDLSAGELRDLRILARKNPEDPRPHLLLGHVYFGRRWRSDALERYELAYETAPNEAKGDPRMLANLVAMAAAPGSLGAKAAAAVERIYGTEARPAVEAALGSRGVSPGEKARLRSLEQSLAR